MKFLKLSVRSSAISMALGMGMIIPTAVLTTMPMSAQAADIYWNCDNSFWDYDSCWNPNGIPTSLDTVYVNTVGGIDTLLQIDNVTGNAYADTLLIDATTGTTVTLQ